MQGSAEVRVAPDRAFIYVTVDADGGSRDDAYAKATTSANGVDQVLQQHADAIDRTVTAALSVQPLTRWKKGESVRTGWRASRRSTVEVTGFERLGELLAALTSWATLAGPTWQVDDTNPAYIEVRRAAAAQARSRAEAYAAGLGVAIGAVAWISEPGLRPTEPAGGFAPQSRAMFAMADPGAARGGMSGDEEVIDVSPQDSIISAAIEVGFSIVDP